VQARRTGGGSVEEEHGREVTRSSIAGAWLGRAPPGVAGLGAPGWVSLVQVMNSVYICIYI
jgi:hypothetical protein